MKPTIPLTPVRHKLFLELFPSLQSEREQFEAELGRQIGKLRDNGVATVFMITADTVEKEGYVSTVKRYKEAGFTVRSLYVPSGEGPAVTAIVSYIGEIASSFERGGTLMLSYNDDATGLLIAGLLLLRGKSIDEALAKIAQINPAFAFDQVRQSLLVQVQGAINLAGGPANRGRNERLNIFIYNRNKIFIPDGHEREIKDALEQHPAPGEKTMEPVTISAEPSAIPVADTIPAKKPEPEKSDITPPLKKKDGPKAGKTPRIQKKKDRKSKPSAAALPPVKTRPFRSIRFKMISIISLIFVVSLSAMIFLASYFFLKDNKIRIEENNHKLSEVTALKVKSDFESVIKRSEVLAASLQRADKKKTDASAGLLRNERDIMFMGIAAPAKAGGSQYISREFNEPLLAEYQISKDDIAAVNATLKNGLTRALAGDTVVLNISQSFRNPVVCLAFPFAASRASSPLILVSFFKIDSVLQAFKTSGITESFMVNEAGDIIAHSDSTLVVSGGNYLGLPIVKMMMKSKLDNGQTRFADERNRFKLGSFKKIGIGGCGVIATVDEERAFQEVYNIQRRNLYIMGIVLTIAVIIVFFFGQSLTTPIIRLVGATQRIKEGDFGVDIEATTRDEIGELTSSFIEMGKGLEERERIKTTFGKFVNKEIAEQLLAGDIHLGGERKDVAILFSDIRSFTAISEKLNPEEVVEFLNDYFSRMVQAIESTNGMVNKFIGDAIMAIWGTPISKGNDTENAVNGALTMRKNLIEFNKGRGGEKKPVIKFGCGINTGPALAGQIGSEDRMEYTVIGDAVNLASRIEALNKPFGCDILISEDSYLLVKDIFAVEQMQPIKVKGKEKPQHVYAVLRRFDDAAGPQNIDELRELLHLEVKQVHTATGAIDEEEVKYEILGQ